MIIRRKTKSYAIPGAGLVKFAANNPVKATLGAAAIGGTVLAGKSAVDTLTGETVNNSK